MAFLPRDDEKRKENEKGKSKKEVEAINEDTLFLRSMKTDRIAHYATKDEETLIAAKARSLRKRSVDKALLKQNTISQQLLILQPGTHIHRVTAAHRKVKQKNQQLPLFNVHTSL